MSEPQAGWLVLACFFGAFAYLLSHLAHRVIQRRQPPQKFAAWMARTQLLAAERVQLSLQVADVETQLAEQLGKLPEDFDGAVFAAARLGHAVERAALDKAVLLGLVAAEDAEAIRRGGYAALPSPGAASLPPPASSPTIPPPPPVPASSRVVPFLLRRR